MCDHGRSHEANGVDHGVERGEERMVSACSRDCKPSVAAESPPHPQTNNTGAQSGKLQATVSASVTMHINIAMKILKWIMVMIRVM
jgi:hypothetical protein